MSYQRSNSDRAIDFLVSTVLFTGTMYFRHSGDRVEPLIQRFLSSLALGALMALASLLLRERIKSSQWYASLKEKRRSRLSRKDTVRNQAP